ncbi:MAG: glycosyltransferase family 2 protein [Bacteroidetes bacterium]|nr:glycosyltransferase family 2 protein [Bacteroidota bacterium]
MDNNRKISFCTVVRNRLHHLRETLPKNIDDNNDHPNLQFLILDYNSDDGLEQWIKENMQKHISSGRLVFYRTTEPAFFKRSHSRNMAFMLADGDLVCNLDADNFTGKGFASYLSSEFDRDENIFISTHGNNKQPDLLGRVCCRKSDFKLIGGYDEEMEGYGFEDFDLINRLGLLGLKKIIISDLNFLNAIAHSDKERISGEKNLNMVSRLFFSYINPSKTEILILFKDSTFNLGRLIDCKTAYASDYKSAVDPVPYEYEYTLHEKTWRHGTWTENESALTLTAQNENEMICRKLKHGILKQNSRKYFEVTDQEMIDNTIFFHSQFVNRNIMRENLTQERISIIQKPGSGTVFRNFNVGEEVVV